MTVPSSMELSKLEQTGQEQEVGEPTGEEEQPQQHSEQYAEQ